MGDLVIYGSYGYTGTLIAEAAVDRGEDPVLAGRERRSLESQAARLGCAFEVVGLDEPEVLDRLLDDATAVLNCAGPFSRTAESMVEACLRTGTHYLDITGEIEVFEALHDRDAAAEEASVMLLPGVGFDVVPTDCLAAHLAERLPDADSLELAIRAEHGISRGTATTMVEHVEDGCAVRTDGELQTVPLAHERRTVDFGWGHDDEPTATFPWGDVSTAYYTTGIPNIRVSMAMDDRAVQAIRLADRLSSVLAAPAVKQPLKWYVQRTMDGPDAQERATAHSYVWGEVRTDDGERAVSRLRCPHGYALTVETALLCAGRVLDGDAPPGFQTPAGAYGPDLILDVDGVEREDVN